MNNRSAVSGTGMDVVEGCLVVPVVGNMDPEIITRLGREILAQVKATQAKKVIINISAIKILDSYIFSIFRSMATAITMLGATPVFVGIQPGVASSLVDLDMDLGDILTAVTTNDAFEILRHQTTGPKPPEIVNDKPYINNYKNDGNTKERENG